MVVEETRYTVNQGGDFRGREGDNEIGNFAIDGAWQVERYP
jgi:hypothetical protein